MITENGTVPTTSWAIRPASRCCQEDHRRDQPDHALGLRGCTTSGTSHLPAARFADPADLPGSGSASASAPHPVDPVLPSPPVITEKPTARSNVLPPDRDPSPSPAILNSSCSTRGRALAFVHRNRCRRASVPSPTRKAKIYVDSALPDLRIPEVQHRRAARRRPPESASRR